MATISEKIDKILDEKIQKIKPENIANGIQIFDIVGNANILNGEEKIVDPSTITQEILPSGEHNGLTKVTINKVTHNIDANILAENIVSGTTILGVTGTAPLLFATVDELNLHTDYPENTFAIVYGTSYIGTYKLDKNVWTQIGDSTQEVQVMETLNKIDNVQDEYEGLGGTDEEVNTVLNNVIGGSQI